MFDDAREGHLGRSRIAHAEMNALVQLSSERTYEEFTLFTALEPCHLCLSAAIAVRIGALHYACVDRYGGAVGKLLPSRDHLAHAVEIIGPLPGAAARLPEVLLVAHCLWRRPDGDVVRTYRSLYPDVAAAAKRVPAPDSGATLDDALSALLAH